MSETTSEIERHNNDAHSSRDRLVLHWLILSFGILYRYRYLQYIIICVFVDIVAWAAHASSKWQERNARKAYLWSRCLSSMTLLCLYRRTGIA